MNFYDELYKMKNLVRRGWVLRNLSDKSSGRQESDAEHVFFNAFISMENYERREIKFKPRKSF